MTAQQRSFSAPSLLLLLIIFLSACSPLTPAPTKSLPSPAMMVQRKLENALPTASMTFTLTPITDQATLTDTPTILPTALPGACVPPNGQAKWVVYTVQAEDTLYSLAGRTLTTVAQIQEANCRDAADIIIYDGQPLYLPFIPPPLPAATKTEKVRRGRPRPTPTASGPGGPTMDVRPSLGYAGRTFKFVIEGLDPFEEVTIKILRLSDGKPIVKPWTAIMDQNGKSNDVKWKSPENLGKTVYLVVILRWKDKTGLQGTFQIE